VAWEIAIKRRLGKLEGPSELQAAIAECGFLELPVSIDDALRTESLPLHHNDPFDRLLVAQAIGLNATLVTRDENQQKYSVALLRA
jgi:PIN domain nuclease of toxin-antitoxin system